MSDERVCIGAFAGAHGVHGAALVKTFTESPDAISAYGEVETEDGSRRFQLKFVRSPKADMAIVKSPEIKTREDALALKGQRLYVSRDALPAPEEDEFYLTDLVGLKVVDENNASAGLVRAVFNFGAGDLLEIEKIPGMKGVRLVSFRKEIVTEIDIAAGMVRILREALILDNETND